MLSIERTAAAHAGPRYVLAVCAAVGIVASSAAAQQPATSRDELIRKWDLDRDGKISDGETEIARSRMRRARLNAELGSGTDPLTGRPRADENATGRAGQAIRPEPGSSPAIRPEGDDSLILVPGTGDRGGRPLGLAAEPEPQPRREREALPGNRAPELVPSVPQAAVRGSQPLPNAAPSARSGGSLLPGRENRGISRDERSPGAGRELTSRARMLPGGPPPAVDGSRPQPLPARPGVIAGGAAPGSARAVPPAVRPGYGSGAPSDLNAGRLPGGPPPARGIASGPPPAARIGPEAQSMPGRRLPPGMSGVRPGLSSPPPLSAPPRVGGTAPPTRPTTAPRVPRPAAENVYGR
jgi:hypothetical protein